MFAQWRGAEVAQVAAGGRRAHDHQLPGPIIRQVVRRSFEAMEVLQQQFLDGRLGQLRAFERNGPINVEVALAVHREHALHSAGSAQGDPAMLEVYISVIQIELQLLRPQHQAHVPDALLGEGLGLGRDAGRQFMSVKVGQVKIALGVQGDRDIAQVLGALQDNAARLDDGLVQVYSQVRVGLHLGERPVPPAVDPERFCPAQRLGRFGYDVSCRQGAVE